AGFVYDALTLKLYFDLTYDYFIVRGYGRLAEMLSGFDRVVVDGIVNGAGAVWRSGTEVGSLLDTYVIDGAVNGTATLIRAAGAKVSPLPWPGSFAAARNASLDLATGDFILVLDADEWLAPGAGQHIRRMMASGPYGFELRIRNYLSDGGDADAAEHYLLRLFPNRPHLRYIGRIHEQLVSLDPEHPLERRGYPELIVLHDGYRADVVDAKGKTQRNRELLVLAVAEEPDNPFHYFNLAQNQRNSGEHREALQTLEYCLHLAKPDAAYVVPAWIQVVGMTLELMGADAAWERLQEAPVRCFDNPDYWIAQAGVLLLVGEPMLAIASYERAAGFARTPPRGQSRYERSSLTWKPYAGIANCWIVQGHPERAVLYLRQSLRECPNNPMIQEKLGELEKSLGAVLCGAG
ncbi:MAG: hypothetical protein CVV27_04690, partial [Candidatus Melainabacteria bacterium HGW-Melainabacteria-1]